MNIKKMLIRSVIFSFIISYSSVFSQDKKPENISNDSADQLIENYDGTVNEEDPTITNYTDPSYDTPNLIDNGLDSINNTYWGERVLEAE